MIHRFASWRQSRPCSWIALRHAARGSAFSPCAARPFAADLHKQAHATGPEAPANSRWRRYVLYSAIGALVLYNWSSIDWTAQVFVRCLRSLGAAAVMTLDYKWSLREFRSLDLTDTRSLAYQEYLSARSVVHLRCARRLLDTLCANGGIYIKLGQHLASLDYLLPMEYCRTMAVLQDAAPQSTLAEINAVFLEDFGATFSELFADFEQKPLGTASLAQVHRATLRTGQSVAVKIQHRRIKSHADMDIQVVQFAIRTVKYLFPEFQFDWLAGEMRENISRELDFTQEARNAERTAVNFRHDPRVKVPGIFWPLTTSRILTMEYTPGGKVNDVGYMKAHGISPRDVSRVLNQVYSAMIFQHGFVHCDPHPGNLFVRRKSSRAGQGRFLSRVSEALARLAGRSAPTWELVILDHGLYRDMSECFRLDYANLWVSILRGDEAGMSLYSHRLGGIEAHRLFSCILTQRSWRSIESGSMRHGHLESPEELEAIREKASLYLAQIADILAKVPRDLLLLFKTNDLLKSISRTLQADSASPYSETYEIMARACLQAMLSAAQSKAGHSWLRKWLLHVYFWTLDVGMTLGHYYALLFR